MTACAEFWLRSAENVSSSDQRPKKILAPISDHLRRAAAADRFTGKSGSTLDIIAPAGLNAPRLVVIGIGKERDLKDRDLVRLGGVAIGGSAQRCRAGDDCDRICGGRA